MTGVGLAAVVQDVLVSAASILKGVGEDGHPVKGTLLIDSGYESCHCGSKPGGIHKLGTKRQRTKDLSEQVDMHYSFVSVVTTGLCGSSRDEPAPPFLTI